MNKKEETEEGSGQSCEEAESEFQEQRTSEEQEEEQETQEEQEERLKREVEELEASLKKMMADFDNYRKRMAKEKKRIIERATQSLMSDLLDVHQDFERALDSGDGGDDDAVEMIYRKFDRVLKDHGLSEIDAEGEEFDPMYHECMISEEVDDEDKHDKVIQQFEKGYELNSKVIKPAKVKVGRYEKKKVEDKEEVKIEDEDQEEKQEVKEDG